MQLKQFLDSNKKTKQYLKKTIITNEESVDNKDQMKKFINYFIKIIFWVLISTPDLTCMK